jgi:hypothetical protein
MRIRKAVKQGSALAAALCLLIALSPLAQPVQARRHSSKHHTSGGGTSKCGSRSTRHHGRHHSRTHKESTAAKPRYAYPVDMFLMQAPEQDLSMFAPEQALKVRYAFQSGLADNYSPADLVRAGAVNFYPLHGGIFKRREEVKYIIVHSTETGVPQDARHVINAWSSGGRRHPGAQYIVDRDGTIFETVDPEYATVHVNIFKTLPGINNDNSIGIEMCHTGNQNYPPELRASVTRLVTYLQDRYHVLNDNVITHRYAQQGDHTDPVAFDWEGFLASKDEFRNRALAMKRESPPAEESVSADADVPDAAVYLEMHRQLKLEDSAKPAASLPTIQQLQQELQTVQQIYTGRPSMNFLDGVYPANNRAASTNAQPPQARAGKPSQLPIRGEIELSPNNAAEVAP